MLEDQVKKLQSELKQSQMSQTIVMNEINEPGPGRNEQDGGSYNQPIYGLKAKMRQELPTT